MEQIYQDDHGKRFRPFLSVAGVTNRGVSQPLQRVITDFGADVPFHLVPMKLQEHHGVEVGVSTIRRICLKHADLIRLQQEEGLCNKLPEDSGVPVVIAQADGSMVPIVETGVGQSLKESEAEQKLPPVGDKRKLKKLEWKEAKPCVARQHETIQPFFQATMGPAQEAGQRLAHCVIRAGAGSESKIHCVGDGAPWIANQVEEHFGAQASYLIDYPHLCQYLEAASKSTGDSGWLATQKIRLKSNQLPLVVMALKEIVEPEDFDEQPARACLRYLSNRPGQFDYHSALQNGLPIGSGEIESGHRHVIQARLKRPGAWWLLENAEKMLALRVNRSNGDWDDYWASSKLKELKAAS